MIWPQEELGVYKMLEHNPLVRQAININRELFKDQYRKGTKIPYFEHLIAVACLVKLHGGTENQIIAGLFHDTIEDQGDKMTIDEIRKQFGDEVADIVMECTQIKSKLPYREHKGKFIDKLNAGLVAPNAHLVITCDKLHNAQSIVKDYILIGEKLWDRFRGDKEDIVWYYTELYKGLRKCSVRYNNPLLDELERAVRVINSL